MIDVMPIAAPRNTLERLAAFTARLLAVPIAILTLGDDDVRAGAGTAETGEWAMAVTSPGGAEGYGSVVRSALACPPHRCRRILRVPRCRADRNRSRMGARRGQRHGRSTTHALRDGARRAARHRRHRCGARRAAAGGTSPGQHGNGVAGGEPQGRGGHRARLLRIARARAGSRSRRGLRVRRRNDGGRPARPRHRPKCRWHARGRYRVRPFPGARARRSSPRVSACTLTESAPPSPTTKCSRISKSRATSASGCAARRETGLGGWP